MEIDPKLTIESMTKKATLIRRALHGMAAESTGEALTELEALIFGMDDLISRGRFYLDNDQPPVH